MTRKQGDAEALRQLESHYSTYNISSTSDGHSPAGLLRIAAGLRKIAERLGDAAASAYLARAAEFEAIAAEEDDFIRRALLRPDDEEAQMFAEIARQAAGPRRNPGVLLGKLSKAQQNEFLPMRDYAVQRVEDFKDFVSAEHEAATPQALAALVMRAKALADAAHAACTSVADWAATFADEQTDEYSEKTERWQESDRGNAVSSFIDEWANAGTAPEEVTYDVPDPEDGYPASGYLLSDIDGYDLESYGDTLAGLPLDSSDF